MTPFATFAAAVQKAARSGTWSLGVKLARAEGVSIESRDAKEIVVRVKAPGRAVAPSVVLYPSDTEWECDCPSKFSPCEHVVAAIIVLGQAELDTAAALADQTASEQPGGPPAPPRPAAPVANWGHVVYRFSRAVDGLRLTRAIVYPDGRETPIETTLSSILSRPQEASTISPDESDLLADRLLEAGARGVLAPSKLDALMKVLAGAPRALLDGRIVAIAEDDILPRATVDDRGDDVVVTIWRDPRIREIVSPGVALCLEDGTETLHPLGEIDLCGARLQNLPAVKTYPPAELGTLATTVLPDLMRRLAVDMRSQRLPRLVRGIPPRMVLDLTHLGESLSVLPTLVYGSPALARIDDGKMVHLGGGVPLRDQAAERTMVQRLRDQLNLVPGRRATFNGLEAPRFAQKLRTWRGDLTGAAAGIVTSQRRLEPQLSVQATDGATGAAPLVGFDVTFTVTGDNGSNRASDGSTSDATVDATSVVRAWREGLGLVPLGGGGWAELPHAWLDKHGARLADLLAARDEGGHLATHALGELRAFCLDLDTPPPPALDHLTPLIEGFERLPAPVLPADLTATLRPYQHQGVAWLSFLRKAGVGGILADDMGLGKTLQALCVAGPGTLVICPTSVLHNWAAEVRRFRPDLRVSLYHGPGRQLDPGADLTLTSYALLRLDRVALSARRWSTLILDEAQAIKNPDSQVARAAFGLQADLRLALSGTPVENRLEELWSLVHFTNRGLLGGRADFSDRYSGPIALGDAAASEGLRRRIRPFVLRRLKRDVAPELPPRTEAILHVELDDHERAVYDAVRAATRADLVALINEGGSVMKALEALLRLRQASCHAGLIPGQVASRSSKVDSLVSALSDAAADGHKALVFSQWTSFLDLIEPHLEQAGIAFNRLDGSTRDRAAVTEAFQSADGPPVMLISLKAGGSGLNLTAADHVFLCDPWWNPAVENQAADRAHRIGQERPVMIYRLVSMGTVEEKILALQQQKRELANIALDETAAAAALTRDDLLALLA